MASFYLFAFPSLPPLLSLTLDSVILGTSLVLPQGGDRALSASSTAGSLTCWGKLAGDITWSRATPPPRPFWEAAECGSKSLGPYVRSPGLGGGLGGCLGLSLIRSGTPHLQH